jgi:hypothetical protein
MNIKPPPLSAVGAPAFQSQIDFVRGFGLDTPLELEEEDEDFHLQRTERSEDEEDGDTSDSDNGSDLEAKREIDDATTPGDSRWHSRHVSRISAALSLRSVGGNFHDQFEKAQKEMENRGDDTKVDDFGSSHSAQDETPEEVGEEIPRPNDRASDWTGSSDNEVGNALSKGFY